MPLYACLRSLAQALLLTVPLLAAAPYTLSEKRVLWTEACYTFNGLAYTYKYVLFTDRASAEAYQVAPYRRGHTPQSSTTFTLRYNELPLRVREKMNLLEPGECSDPFLVMEQRAWGIIHLQKRNQAAFDKTINPLDWLDKYAESALPSPHDLMSDPALMLRSRLNQAITFEALKEVLGEALPEQCLDRSLSSGWTPLQRAIALKDLRSAEALLTKGANPNKSSDGNHPLVMAIFSKNEAMIDLLLKYKADPNGGEMRLTPLMAASETGDIRLVKRLLGAGGDPMKQSRSRQQYADRTSLLYHASSKDAELYAFLKNLIDDRLALQGLCVWDGWIEQSGRRHPIRPGADITLRKAPFKLLFNYHPGVTLAVIGVGNSDLSRALKDASMRRTLVGPGRMGAIGPDSKFLSVTDGLFEGNEISYLQVFLNLGFDPQVPNGVKLAKDLYEYTVDEIVWDKLGTKERGESPIQEYPGRGFSLLFGVLQPIGRGGEFFREPLVVRIHLTGK